MKLISASTEASADQVAKKLGLSSVAYIYVPEEQPERDKRLRCLYNIRLSDLIGEFSYDEEQRVTRIIG